MAEKGYKRWRTPPFTGKLVIAPHAEAEEYDPEIREFLWEVFRVARYLVTDKSPCSDFYIQESNWQEVAAERFDIPKPEATASVVDVAKAIRARRLPAPQVH